MKKHLRKVIDASPGTEIVVSDDCSSDGSVEYIKKYFPNVIIVTNTVRQGFAGNINMGVSKATGDIVILINTDVEPEKGYLIPLLSHFRNPDVFAVGCLEKSIENGNMILRGRGIAHWEKGYYIHSRGDTEKRDTAWVSGGSGAFRKSMWDTLGGMDKLYNPFYWEDIDLSYRARKAGWKTVFEQKSIIRHYHEEGKIKREYSPEDVKKIVYRNQYIFIWKNLTDPPLILKHLFWAPIRIIQSIYFGNYLHPTGFFSALGRLFPIIRYRLRCVKYRYSDNDLAIWR
jgi:GT2 family glycosyltransferase